VVVSHDRELAFQIANRIAMLDEGRIVAIGTPDEIRRNPDPRVHQFLAACIIPRVAVCDRLSSVDAKLIASKEGSS
jgi:ABC-type proline/glycine betaine transport system ATPase subunit